MDPLAYRVAARFLRANLEHEFIQRFEKLLHSPGPMGPTPEEVQDFRKWITDNFRLSGRVPKEGKMAQSELVGFWKNLEQATTRFGLVGVQDRDPGDEHHGKSKFFLWFHDFWEHRVKRELSNMVKYLSSEGTGKTVPVIEKKVGGNTFINLVGASEARFDEMISGIEKVFSELVGWRKKALAGGVRVIFAGPKDFHGTAGGTYRSEKDELWIRATTGGRIEKNSGGYGGLDYVIVHELGHRYERKQHVPFDFDRPEWYTSRYSMKDGETFAELFALSNFGMTNQGGAEVLPKFEHLMTTGKMPPPATSAHP